MTKLNCSQGFTSRCMRIFFFIINSIESWFLVAIIIIIIDFDVCLLQHSLILYQPLDVCIICTIVLSLLRKIEIGQLLNWNSSEKCLKFVINCALFNINSIKTSIKFLLLFNWIATYFIVVSFCLSFSKMAVLNCNYKKLDQFFN